MYNEMGGIFMRKTIRKCLAFFLCTSLLLAASACGGGASGRGPAGLAAATPGWNSHASVRVTREARVAPSAGACGEAGAGSGACGEAMLGLSWFSCIVLWDKQDLRDAWDP